MPSQILREQRRCWLCESVKSAIYTADVSLLWKLLNLVRNPRLLLGLSKYLSYAIAFSLLSEFERSRIKRIASLLAIDCHFGRAIPRNERRISTNFETHLCLDTWCSGQPLTSCRSFVSVIFFQFTSRYLAWISIEEVLLHFDYGFRTTQWRWDNIRCRWWSTFCRLQWFCSCSIVFTSRAKTTSWKPPARGYYELTPAYHCPAVYSDDTYVLWISSLTPYSSPQVGLWRRAWRSLRRVFDSRNRSEDSIREWQCKFLAILMERTGSTSNLWTQFDALVLSPPQRSDPGFFLEWACRWCTSYRKKSQLPQTDSRNRHTILVQCTSCLFRYLEFMTAENFAFVWKCKATFGGFHWLHWDFSRAGTRNSSRCHPGR